MPKFTAFARLRSSGVTSSTASPNTRAAVAAWKSAPEQKAATRMLVARQVREQPQLYLRIVCGQKEAASSSGTKHSLIWRPNSVRTGMFCRLGSDDDRRPVVVTVLVELVCTRPSSARMRGSASM